MTRCPAGNVFDLSTSTRIHHNKLISQHLCYLIAFSASDLFCISLFSFPRIQVISAGHRDTITAPDTVLFPSFTA
jgi:hypothetical protein